MNMRVVVVGSGGREHALAWKFVQDGHDVLVTPGNPGIPWSVETSPEELGADLFVVGPEVPLVQGLADRLRTQGKVVFGPGADGAQLEGSKIWMKELLDAAGVPTAPWAWFDRPTGAIAHLRTMQPPYVIKTDGLAAGKGVLVTCDLDEAIADAKTKLTGEAFGDAGRRIVIEQGLRGRELSFFALLDGRRWLLLPSARDYKRLRDDDEGLNTGGMGAFSPVPDGLDAETLGPILNATVAELNRRGIDYRGILYGGLMLTKRGPMMLEYNIRFGDPEAQVILPRINGDLAHMLWLTANGSIPASIKTTGACVTVVLASEGYPKAPRTGDVITRIEAANEMEGVTVFHAGTARDEHGRFITAGGRVLNITAYADTVPKARRLVYKAVSYIHFDGMQYRRDIAADVL